MYEQRDSTVGVDSNVLDFSILLKYVKGGRVSDNAPKISSDMRVMSQRTSTPLNSDVLMQSKQVKTFEERYINVEVKDGQIFYTNNCILEINNKHKQELNLGTATEESCFIQLEIDPDRILLLHIRNDNPQFTNPKIKKLFKVKNNKATSVGIAKFFRNLVDTDIINLKLNKLSETPEKMPSVLTELTQYHDIVYELSLDNQ